VPGCLAYSVSISASTRGPPVERTAASGLLLPARLEKKSPFQIIKTQRAHILYVVKEPQLHGQWTRSSFFLLTNVEGISAWGLDGRFNSLGFAVSLLMTFSSGINGRSQVAATKDDCFRRNLPMSSREFIGV